MKPVWSVALCLFLASPALAETSVSVEEWLYLQRIGLISSVNENLWTAFEESGAANPELARYAKEVTHVNVVSLRKWGAPAAPLVESSWEAIEYRYAAPPASP